MLSCFSPSFILPFILLRTTDLPVKPTSRFYSHDFSGKFLLDAGKAGLLTVGGVVVGALLGTVVENWLRVDIFPVLGVSSPAVVVSEFAYLALWACSGYLR